MRWGLGGGGSSVENTHLVVWHGAEADERGEQVGPGGREGGQKRRELEQVAAQRRADDERHRGRGRETAVGWMMHACRGGGLLRGRAACVPNMHKL